MGGTDIVSQGQKQPSDAPPALRWLGWFIEKVGVPAAIIFTLLVHQGTKLDKINQTLERLVTVAEAKK